MPAAPSDELLGLLSPLLPTGTEAARAVRQGRLLRYELPGAQVSLKALARVLKRLPRSEKVEGSFRHGAVTGALAFDGRLTKGRLKPPSQDGVRLLWTDPPPQLDGLHLEAPKRASDRPEASFEAVPKEGQPLESFALKGLEVRLYVGPSAPRAGASSKGAHLELWSAGSLQERSRWEPASPRLKTGWALLRLSRTKPWSARAAGRLAPLLERLARRVEAWEAQSFSQSTPEHPGPEVPSPGPTDPPPLPLEQALLASPKLRSSYSALDGHLFKLDQLSQLFAALQEGRDRLPFEQAIAILGGEPKLEPLYSTQLEELFPHQGQPCLSRSLDGQTLLLHREALIERFELTRFQPEDPRRVTCSGLDGRELVFDSPVELSDKEALALSALLRYGTLSERELGRLLGTRRIAGLLDRLVGRLAEAGCYALKEAGTGDDGRLYRFDAGQTV